MAPTCHDANDAAATLVGIGAWADPHLLALQSQGCKAEPRESESPVRPELVYGPLSEQPKSVYISTPSVEVDPCGHQIEAGKQAQALSRRNDAQHWLTPVEPKARRLSHIKAARGGRSQPECHDSKERSPTYLVDILDIGSAKSMDQGRTVRHVWHGVRLFCKRLNCDAYLSVENWSQSLVTGRNLQSVAYAVLEYVGNVPFIPCALDLNEPP